ncbi:MAG: OsmC family protein [Gemmatimonadaceae bacterium]
MTNLHAYRAQLVWDGNRGDGTSNYATYGRRYTIRFKGKSDLAGSADAMFRGDADLHNPEDLFIASLSSCHLLSYLALCARNKISVIAYEDEASGTLELKPGGSGAFSEVTLHPLVTIAEGGDEELAMKLHDKAHEQCFIASSVKIPVHHEPVVRVDHNVKVREITPEASAR